ncbi:hypothetical protein BCR36DRAFT_72225 [Piromyces finnis]|uniref:GATA-type domain-containing protein n=1 Tax=Piromyces finnis TaxID=1754191 RepID=A0A1Y1V6P6_9FUNG|nr:hypothetical protein BCR36DRAFT_72225 [Piromyces finnis]|eukprot:ORX48633.1 hypothetical protein BCR36DRAFT_72225 [Piromyces finnis]
MLNLIGSIIPNEIPNPSKDNDTNNKIMNDRNYRNDQNRKFNDNENNNQKRSRTFSSMNQENSYCQVKLSNHNNSSLPNDMTIDDNNDTMNCYDGKLDDTSRGTLSNNTNSNNNPCNSSKDISISKPNKAPNDIIISNNSSNNNNNSNNISTKSPINKHASFNNKDNYPVVEYTNDYKPLAISINNNHKNIDSLLETNNTDPDNPSYSAHSNQYNYHMPSFISNVVNNYDNSYHGEMKADNNIRNNNNINNHINSNPSSYPINDNIDAQNQNYKGNHKYITKFKYNDEFNNDNNKMNNAQDLCNSNSNDIYDETYHSKMMPNFPYSSKFQKGDISIMKETNYRDDESFIVNKKMNGTKYNNFTKINSYYYDVNLNHNDMDEYRVRVNDSNNNYNSSSNSEGISNRNNIMEVKNSINDNRNLTDNQKSFYSVNPNNGNSNHADISMSFNINYLNDNNYNNNYNNSTNSSNNRNINDSNYNNYNRYNNTIIDTNNNNHGNVRMMNDGNRNEYPSNINITNQMNSNEWVPNYKMEKNEFSYNSNNISYSRIPPESNSNKSYPTTALSTGKRGRKKIVNLNQEYIDNTLKNLKSDKKIKRCENCGVDRSPEWRRGPSGHKTLCNACGLRYSRTINRYLNQQRAKNNNTFDINNPLASISKSKRKKKNG